EFYWRIFFDQPPFVIRVAKNPIGFFGTDNQTSLERFVFHEIARHFYCQNSDGAVSDYCVTCTGNSENRSEMTGRGVENWLGKKQWTRRLRAGRDDVVIKTFRVNDAPIRNRK